MTSHNIVGFNHQLAALSSQYAYNPNIKINTLIKYKDFNNPEQPELKIDQLYFSLNDRVSIGQFHHQTGHQYSWFRKNLFQPYRDEGIILDLKQYGLKFALQKELFHLNILLGTNQSQNYSGGFNIKFNIPKKVGLKLHLYGENKSPVQKTNTFHSGIENSIEFENFKIKSLYAIHFIKQGDNEYTNWDIQQQTYQEIQYSIKKNLHINLYFLSQQQQELQKWASAELRIAGELKYRFKKYLIELMFQPIYKKIHSARSKEYLTELNTKYLYSKIMNFQIVLRHYQLNNHTNSYAILFEGALILCD